LPCLIFKASVSEILQRQQPIPGKSRLPIPSRSRDGEGGLNRIDCHVVLLLAMTRLQLGIRCPYSRLPRCQESDTLVDPASNSPIMYDLVEVPKCYHAQKSQAIKT